MKTAIYKVTNAFLIAFAAVALMLGYWSLAQKERLLSREDNPRRITAEQEIYRGQIVDRNGVVLANSVYNPDINVFERVYPFGDTASVVGYYSLRYGVSGIESAYDSELRGDRWTTPGDQQLGEILHRQKIGGDVRLTIDIAVQEAASVALDGQRGAIVVIHVSSGDIIALVSRPAFNPNTLDENWDSLTADPDAPLIMRATQGLYQPGTAFQTVYLSDLLNNRMVELSDRALGPKTVLFDGVILPCVIRDSRATTIAEVYVSGCPGPFQVLGRQSGFENVVSAVHNFRLSSSVELEIPVESDEIDGDDLGAGVYVIGQGDLTVTPLHMAMVAVVIGDNGRMPPLRLVDAVRQPGGAWLTTKPLGRPYGVISPGTAAIMRDLMLASAQENFTSEFTVPVYGHAGLAISSFDNRYDAWFIGLAEVLAGEYVAVAVLVEDVQDANPAIQLAEEVFMAISSQP